MALDGIGRRDKTGHDRRMHVTFIGHMFQCWDVNPSRWLEAAFGAESRVRILRLLAARPHRTWTERAIAAEVGMSANAINRATRSLREAGIVRVERVGNAHAVRLASEPLLANLREVFRAEGLLFDRVLREIGDAVPVDASCYLYGSTVRDEARPESDVDLLVVARDRETAAEIAYRIESKVHAGVPARLQIVALGVDEARKRYQKRDGLVKAAVGEGRLVGGSPFEEVAAS